MDALEEQTAALTLHAACERKRKFAWAKYYEAMGLRLQNAHVVVGVVQPHLNQPLRQVTERPTELPAHITNEFFDMACALNKSFECPVCLVMPATKEDMVITLCGHIYCKVCHTTLKAQQQPKCAVCRRSL